MTPELAPKGPPFAWQDKRVLRRIREQCEDHASALATYFALTVAASDSQKEEFETTLAWLAALSGFSGRTVWSRLRDLEKIKVVAITTPAMKAPCTYRLLPFSNDCATSGNGCRAFSNRKASPLPRSEVRKLGSVHTHGEEGRGIAKRISLEKGIEITKRQLIDLEDRATLEGGWTRELVEARKAKKSKLHELESQLVNLL